MKMNTLDRYVLRKYLTSLAATIFAFTVIVFVVDFVERGWRLMQRFDVAAHVMALYYANYMPFYVILAFPVAMLVSTLFSIGSLAKNHELDVMKASGLSLYRIASPILVAAFILSLGVMVFAELVLTGCEKRKDDIYAYQMEKRPPVARMTRHDIKVPGRNGWLILADAYDVTSMAADGIKIHRILDNKIVKSYSARKMIREDSIWVLIDGSSQAFSSSSADSLSSFARFDTLRVPFITQTPDMLAELPVPPRQVNFFALRKRIGQDKELGEPAYKDQVELYLKITFPLANFILVLIGAPLAANPRRSGPSVGFGLAIIISFIFFVLIRIGQSLGNSGKLPPLLGASLGDIVFLLIGAGMLFKARK
jgi:lipopolysaccharide export system permease protein